MTTPHTTVPEEEAGKDEWPDPPKAVPGYPSALWPAHLVAFIAKGRADGAGAPTVTVLRAR